MEPQPKPRLAPGPVKPMSRGLHTSLQFLLLCTLLGSALPALGQSADQYINKGNQDYRKQDFTDAEAQYQKALSRNSRSDIGLFNLGNSFYSQKRYEDAYKAYRSSSRWTKSPNSLADAHYNMGNTYMEKKDWKHSMDAFKKTLLLHPQDNEARYNLAYAEEMMKKNGGSGKNNQKQNQKNQQNKKQSGKNSRQNKNQNQQNKDKQQNSKQSGKNRQAPQPGTMTRKQAQQLLNALAQQEQKIQGKLDKNKSAVPPQVTEDW